MSVTATTRNERNAEEKPTIGRPSRFPEGRGRRRMPLSPLPLLRLSGFGHDRQAVLQRSLQVPLAPLPLLDPLSSLLPFPTLHCWSFTARSGQPAPIGSSALVPSCERCRTESQCSRNHSHLTNKYNRMVFTLNNVELEASFDFGGSAAASMRFPAKLDERRNESKR